MENSRKSKEQRSWELRKMQTAGLDINKKEIGEVSDSPIDLNYKTSLFLNHKYYESGIDNVINTKNEMFRIGNKESEYYEKFKEDVEKYQGNFYLSKYNADQNENRNLKISLKNQEIDQIIYDDIFNLPVYKKKNDFLSFYKLNNVMVVTGETGSGKSTLVPKLIFDHFSHKIAITQPRRISVKSLYQRMKSFYKDEVGYSIRFENHFNENTKIKIMTEGILLNEIQEDGLLLKYDTIILDEAHERSVNLDILIGFLKKIHLKRPELKIIIMSATINVSKFTLFFDCKHFSFDGKNFPIEIKYLEVDVDDHLEWTVKQIIRVISKEKEGDILVFLSGKDDIDKVFKLICHFLQKSNLIIVKCYSEIVNEVYDLIFNSKVDLRRIILSTNVSEASITIPNIKFVIDNGFNKILIYDYAQGDVLVKCPISKESAIQRAGRCGRTGPGVCYRMYTKQTYEEIFNSNTVPEILRSDLSRILLLLVNLSIKDIYSLPLIDVPGRKLVDSCYDFLILMEALNLNRKITALGELILTLGTDCVTGKMIYEGIKRSCSYEMVLLVSILSLESAHILKILNQVRDKQIEFYKFTVQNNDFITLINIFKNNLVDKVISEKCNYHLKRLTKYMQMNLTSNNNKNVIETALLHSLFFNLSKKCDKKYLNLISKMDFNLPKNSTVDEDVDYLIYYKNFKARDKNYAYLCMKVDPNLVIKELGNIFENKKEVNYAVKTKRKIVLDDLDLYENFELEEEEVKVKKIKKRRVNI